MSRGGYRPGAGRKQKPEQEKTYQRNFTLSFEANEYLVGFINASKYINQLILDDMKRKAEKPPE